MSRSEDMPLPLPQMRLVRQQYRIPPAVDIAACVAREWQGLDKITALRPGMRIAVGVGSRGISSQATVVREVVGRLRACGCRPFVTPAMGSHGGATARGQIEVLKARGISEQSVDAQVEATMDVVPMGEQDGIPLFMDRLAHEADGIVVINRIKPHTNFIGPTESGIIKMMAIGLGNQKGTEYYHRLAMVRDYYEIISTVGRELIKRSKFLFGVGLVENQDHQTCELRLIPAGDIEAVETEMLKKARQCLPLLPMEEIDLLIVNEMGKDISGEGIDPNVVGRDVCACGARRNLPNISRIVVLDLTDGSAGSALGVGQADFTVQRLVDKIDFEATAVNCITSCCPESGKVPLTLSNDRQAITTALKTVRPYGLDDLRIVQIKNTLELSRMLVSAGCLMDLRNRNDVFVEPDDLALQFDESGNLISQL